MAYDMHGGWDSTTGHHSPLRGVAPGDALCAEEAVKAYLTAGFPAGKLVLGVPFYGRGWQGVGPAANGLHQPGREIAGTHPPDAEWEYRDIQNRLATQPGIYKRYWDDNAKAPWIYAPSINGGTFVTYEDTESMGYKTRLIRDHGLGGVMFWDISSDSKNPADSLLEVLARDLR